MAVLDAHEIERERELPRELLDDVIQPDLTRESIRASEIDVDHRDASHRRKVERNRATSEAHERPDSEERA